MNIEDKIFAVAYTEALNSLEKKSYAKHIGHSRYDLAASGYELFEKFKI